MENQSVATDLKLIQTYSLKLNQSHIQHLKNNEQGVKPSAYLRQLLENDMIRQGDHHGKTI